MTDSIFDGDSVVEKLSKLNSSQQSIESLSRYCISHRKKARQIVEFWDKAFNSAQKEQRVSFLYLSNDILQNSRRKGSEFVNEFWKVLPAALKYVYQNGDEYGKKTAHRLVDIWEERKVFGSRGRNLKDEMLGKDPPPPPAATAATIAASNGKSANPIKIVKRDSHSLRIKLAVGGLPEKIITSFQLVHDEVSNEEGALSKCKAVASLVGKMEKDVEYAYNQGNVQGNVPVLIDELLEKENEVTLCINQLENAGTTRAALISQLKEAVEEQENKLELVRSQLQVARGQVDQMSNMRQKLTSPALSAQPTGNPPLLQTPFSPPKMGEEDSKKAAAAAVAAKLTASTSSAQMLTSILSSLVAEEAASKNSGLNPPGFPIMPLYPPPEKRQKVDTQAPNSDNNNSEMGSNVNYFASQHQMTFPPLPPPPLPTTNSNTNQFVPSSGMMMMGVMPYGYGSSGALQPPPPPPLPSHIAMGLARPSPPPPLQPPQQTQSQSPQSSNGGGYYRPPGIGFYAQNQATVPRQ